jgi:hypothetical protein
MRWLFSKIGQSFSIFVSATVVIFGGVLISNYNLAASEVYLGAITVAEGVRAYLNYRKLAAQKISLE